MVSRDLLVRWRKGKLVITIGYRGLFEMMLNNQAFEHPRDTLDMLRSCLCVIPAL